MSSCCCDTEKLGGFLLSGTIPGVQTPGGSVEKEEVPIAQESLLGNFAGLPWWAQVLIAVLAVGGVAYVAHEGFKGKK